MKNAAAAGLVAVAVLCADAYGLAAHAAATASSVPSLSGGPGHYIVTFADSASAADVAAARKRVRKAGGTVLHDYSRAVRGFAAVLPAGALAEVTRDPGVLAVEADQAVRLSSAPSGLDRIDERSRPTDGRFAYGATGRGTTLYVIDTGIRAGHSQFGGRVAAGYSAVPDDGGTDDCNGHGTYVAGIAGGSTYGVARAATLVPVRVLGCDGTGSLGDVIAGIEWVTANHKGPSVANISAGTPASAALDQAVANSINSGVTYVVAAGNEGHNACRQSPARVPGAITVGAVDGSDVRAAFSNYGSCVDIWAPGVSIRSAYGSGNTATRTLSGTSSATPFVAGAIAAYLQNVPDARPSAVRAVLIGSSTSGRLKKLGSGSPNRLLYSRLPTGTRAPVAEVPSVALPGVDTTLESSGFGVRVRWDASDPDGDRIVSYDLQRSYDGGDTWTTVLSTGATSATVDVRPDSDLRFRVRATDARGRVGAYASTKAMRLVLRQEKDARYTGTWLTRPGEEASGGSSRMARRKGASATFTFTGRRIAWIGSKDTDRGRAKVYVDGRYRGTVSEYASAHRLRRVVFGATLAPGRHTLKIVLTGEHRAGAGPAVEVDAFLVMD